MTSSSQLAKVSSRYQNSVFSFFEIFDASLNNSFLIGIPDVVTFEKYFGIDILVLNLYCLFTMHKTHSGAVILTHFSCSRTGKSADRFPIL